MNASRISSSSSHNMMLWRLTSSRAVIAVGFPFFYVVALTSFHDARLIFDREICRIVCWKALFVYVLVRVYVH